MGIVSPSPWPFLTSCSSLGLVSSLLFKLKYYDFEVSFLVFSLVVLLLIAAFWWADIIRESTFQGLHTVRVQSLLRSGMLLLIVSEIFFFCWFFLGLSPLWSFSQYRVGFGLASSWCSPSVCYFCSSAKHYLVTVFWCYCYLVSSLPSFVQLHLLCFFSFSDCASWDIFHILQGYEYLECSFTIA